MKIKIINLFCVLVMALAFGSVVIAGSLSPSSSPIPSTHTLSDIYNKLINNLYTANILNSFDFPTGEASSTMHTVEEIWNAIPTISSSAIISSSTIMGVEGAYNVSNLIPSNIATGTVYGADNSVGTMVGGITLEWSPTFGPMTWASSTAYCSNYAGVTPINTTLSAYVAEWRLASAKDYSELYGTYFDFFVSPNFYWTSNQKITSTTTLNTINASRAELIYYDDPGMGPGYSIQLYSSLKTGSYYFRCVKNI